MTKKELMEYVGKEVIITFCDDTIYGGVLEYTTAKCAESHNWFILGDTLFKARHVKKFEDKI